MQVSAPAGAHILTRPAGQINFPPGWMICPRCARMGSPEFHPRGSGAIEFILYWFAIIPGVIYSIWRRSDLKPTCPHCDVPMLAPDSPAAQALAEKHYA